MWRIIIGLRQWVGSLAKSSDDGGEEDMFGLSRDGSSFIKFDSEKLDESFNRKNGILRRSHPVNDNMREKIKQRAEARGQGANPASKQRDLDYVKCSKVSGSWTRGADMTLCRSVKLLC